MGMPSSFPLQLPRHTKRPSAGLQPVGHAQIEIFPQKVDWSLVRSGGGSRVLGSTSTRGGLTSPGGSSHEGELPTVVKNMAGSATVRGRVSPLRILAQYRAQAYVDPGSGFVFLQVAGSMFAGTIYYMRHRLKRINGSMRRPARISRPAGVPKDAAETRP